MATFKATIIKHNQREDKTWTVFIRFTHERKVRYISTTMAVTKKDLTASFKFKNQQIIDKCDELIKHYRTKVAKLNLEINSIDIDDIVRYLTTKEEKKGISFTQYFERWKDSQNIKGMKNYISAVNALKNFLGHEDILCDEITVKTLKAFELSLSDRPRAMSLYTNSICRIFSDMRDYYNDEDNDIVRIKHSLKKYHAPKQNVADKRALTIEQVRAIYNLPYLNISHKGIQCRRDLAKDCFLLSFCMMGINSADLYSAGEIRGEEYKDGYVTYFRRKTKDRRYDKAKMVVKVHPVIRSIFEKYVGKEKVFNFSERFSSMADLNRAINIGLKEIGNELGIDGLQFYSARHSMATIATNKVGINKWLVNEMLCHTDSSMRVTDLYIEKDFKLVNDANYKLMEFVFGEV